MKGLAARTRTVFYGWWVVLAGTLLYGLGVGSIFYGFNTFFVPMVSEFGWSRAITSGAFSMSRFEGGLSGPLVGWLIDRFGVRKLALIGVTLAGAGFIALTLVSQDVWTLYVIFGLLISVGFDTGFARACTAAAAKWFIRKRSRAISFITIGGGVGGAAIVPLLGWLIAHYGWRTAAVVVGIMIVALGIPMAYFLRNNPEERGLQPDGVAGPAKDEEGANGAQVRPGSEDASSSGVRDVDFTVRQALKTKAYWTYVGVMVLRASILSSMVIHQMPHLVDMGIDFQLAASILGTMVLMSIPGRFTFGWLGDKWDKRGLLLTASLLQAAGILIFIHATTVWMVYLFVVVFGVGYGGAIPLAHALRADLFGRRIFATLAGITMTMTMVSTVTAPILLGYLYDVTQSYTVGFYVLAGVILVAGFGFLLIKYPQLPGRPSVWEQDATE